ncbi:MAG TPA: M56 family metallopeptidase, partial [Planctomycetaceae bacterium]|nr:M56 family metallopeptidase [Planctomycetaceae bacterium]
KTSEPVEDKELLELLNLVRAELDCRRSVGLRESKSVSSPATVGWRKPIVLLPREWREWSASEQRAVLAHEVAHIRRFDFPAWIVAQMGVVLHFYNPVVHWLAQRLRLEQELAADAAAADVVGGNTVYLQTLAGMAIRQDDRRLSWAARTFLPSHHTFLRRIEMLRRRSPLAARLTGVGRTLIACSLLGAAVFAAGLRSPFEAVSVAQDSPATPKTESNVTGFSSGDGTTGAQSAPVSDGESLSLAYVPRDALIVGAVRPAKILSQPAFAPLKKAVDAQEGMQEMLGLSVLDVQQATMVFLPREGRDGAVQPDEGGIVLLLSKPIDQQSLLKKWLRTPEKSEFAGQTYYKAQFRR